MRKFLITLSFLLLLTVLVKVLLEQAGIISHMLNITIILSAVALPILYIIYLQER